MKSKVNLHVHTKYSNGSKTVPEVVSALKDAGDRVFCNYRSRYRGWHFEYARI
jgi:hypothetical protein